MPSAIETPMSRICREFLSTFVSNHGKIRLRMTLPPIARNLFALLAFSASTATSAPTHTPGFSHPVQTVRLADGKFAIRFGASEPTDATVVITGPNGKIVRHLASGRLGENPPPPFHPGLLQPLTWDLLDDDGKPVDATGCSAKVLLGLQVEFDKIIGWSGQATEQIRGIACGPDGRLYTIFGEQLYAHRQTTLITAFDRDGNYRQQVFPPPSGAISDPERGAGWPVMKRDDGITMPVIQHLLSRSVVPGAVFGNRAIPAVSHDGKQLVFLSGPDAGSTVKHTDQPTKNGRRLMRIRTDGGIGEDYFGPTISLGDNSKLGGFGRVALSPDDRFAYVSGLFDSAGKGRGLCQAVWRVALDDSAPAEIFAGRLFESGSGSDRLNDPQGLATDVHGNLYVCDYGNHRVAIFDPSGKHLHDLPATHPDSVAVSRSSGAVYVMTLKERTKAFNEPHYYIAAHNWSPDHVLKFDSSQAKKPSARIGDLLQTRMGGGAFLALDDSDPVDDLLWICGRAYRGGDIYRVIEKDGDLVIDGSPIADAIGKGETPLPFIGNIAVSGDQVIARHPTFRDRHRPDSLCFDGLSGASLDSFVPKGIDGRDEAYWSLVYGEMVSGRDGNIYVHAKHSLRRYAPDGTPLPYSRHGSHVIGDLHFDRHTNNAGTFATRTGQTWLTTLHKANQQALDRDALAIQVIDETGNIVDRQRLSIEGARTGGLAVDSRGNIYLGAQITPVDVRVPGWVKQNLPHGSDSHSLNAAYAQLGSIVKFPSEGGAIRVADDGEFIGHRQSTSRVRIEEGKIIARAGLVPGKTGDLGPGCACESTRFDIDPHDRLFVPDLHRFCIRVLDSEGNEITRFGSYGNMDDRSPDRIAFGWPLTVRVSGDGQRAYVADLVNRRVVAVKLDYAFESMATF